MVKSRSILKLIDTAERSFFEETMHSPDIIIVNPDGMALIIEAMHDSEKHINPFEDDFMYEDKYISVCTHLNFPLFKLAYSGE